MAKKSSSQDWTETNEESEFFENEDRIWGKMQQWMECRMPQIIRKELHNNAENDERIYNVELWLGMIRIGKRRVYLIPASVIVMIVLMILNTI